MLNIEAIFEYDGTIFDFLSKRNLLTQYKKAKIKILAGNFTECKLREPKQKGIFYFRINQQFRAYAVRKDNALVVYKIDNHQNG